MRQPSKRLVHLILAAFTGTIPVNVDTVVHGAQVRGSRVARNRTPTAPPGALAVGSPGNDPGGDEE
jgi:hypothetical protein